MKLIIVVLVLALLIIPGVYSQSSDFLQVEIAVEDISPQPVEPGNDLTLGISVSNPSDTDMSSFTVDFKPEYPFMIKSSGDNFRSGFLCGGCSIKNTYLLSIDTRAVSGAYEIPFRVLRGNNGITKKIIINVKGTPDIIFSTDSQDLNMLVPDSAFTISININNIGTGLAKEIKVTPSSTDFITLGSSVKTTGLLEPGESKTLSFDFLVSKNVNADSYQIPFTIEYKDESGNELNSSNILVGVRVIESSNLNIQNIKIVSETTGSVIITGVPFNVVVRAENVGFGDAGFVTADISCPFDSIKKAFIGQLEKNEDSPAVFNVVSSKSGTFQCQLSIEYQDGLGEHTLKETFDVTIQSADTSGPVILLVIITLILLFVLRKRIFKGKK